MRLCVLKDSSDAEKISDIRLAEIDNPTWGVQGISLNRELTVLYRNVFTHIPTPIKEIAQAGYILGRKRAELKVAPLNLKGAGGKTFSFYVCSPTSSDPKDAESVHTRCNYEGIWEIITLFGNKAIVYEKMLDTGNGFRELANLVASTGYELARKLAGLEVE